MAAFTNLVMCILPAQSLDLAQPDERFLKLARVVNNEHAPFRHRKDSFSKVVKNYFGTNQRLESLAALWSRLNGIAVSEVIPSLPLTGPLSFAFDGSKGERVVGIIFQFKGASEGDCAMWLGVGTNHETAISEQDMFAIFAGNCPRRLRGIKVIGTSLAWPESGK